MFGVVLVGTYTSVFIASPILIYLGVGTGRDTAQDRRRRPEPSRRGRGPGRICRSRVPVDAYGKGGFRFGGMSHRGSLLCSAERHLGLAGDERAEIDEAALAPVFAEADGIDFFLIGGGRDPGSCRTPAGRFRDARYRSRSCRTGAAVRTYNILLGEGRRVGAGLIAVD